MENNKKSGLMENVTLTEVPINERKSWISVAFIQAGIMICVPSLLLGGMLAESMSLTQAIASGTVGYIIVIVIFSLLGIIGSDLGVPTCVTSESGFGRTGARFLISTMIFVSMIGWFAVQVDVCGNAFSHLIEQFFSVSLSPKISIVIWGIVMLITAVYGIKALDMLNKIAVPLLFIITVIGCFMALKVYGTSQLNVDPVEITMSFLDGVVLTVSFMAAGCLAAADITRYQKTRKDTILSSSIGVAPAGILMVVLGAIMTKVAQQYDIAVVFCDIGIPILGMLVLIAATWTTNTTNAYSGGINAVLLLNLNDNKRGIATMVSGLIGTLCALLGFANSFESFLYILGDLMLPIMGVIISDYWIVGKGKKKNFKVSDGVNWSGVISWAIGYAVIKLIPYGIPFMQGIVIAGLAYVILTKLIGRPQDKIIVNK